MDLTNELRHAYEKVLFRYEDVADLLAQQSNFHRNIVGVERFFCEYFRVGFYGRGMPITIRVRSEDLVFNFTRKFLFCMFFFPHSF
jgi:hypothetical protein